MKKLILSCILLALLFLKNNLPGQSPVSEPLSAPHLEVGYPFIQNYEPEDYQAFDQNFGITQDSLGIMYFANGDGVLIYDGVKWTLIPMKNNGLVYAVECSLDQTIYASGSSEMGYLAIDSTGQLSFISLLDHLKDGEENIGTIRKILSTSQGIYFLSNHTLFRWFEHELVTWKADKENFLGLFNMNDQVTISLRGGGLINLQEGKLVPLPGFTNFKGNINNIVPFDKSKWLVGSYFRGLFVYDGYTLLPFENEQNDYFKNKNIRTITLLQDSSFAIGTLGGIKVIDRTGRLCMSINDKNVIPSQKVFALYQDRSGLLWAGLDYGISKIEYPSGFSIFDKSNGLEGVVERVIRHQDNIYVGSEYGLFVLDYNHDDGSAFFKQVHHTDHFVNDLLAMEDELLFTTDQGLFALKEATVRQISQRVTNSLIRSTIDSNRVFIGYQDGVFALYFDGNQWIDEGRIEGINGEVYAIVELSNGDLWMETSVNSIWNVSFESIQKAMSLEDPMVEVFSSKQGLPDELGRLFSLNQEVYFREIYGDYMYKFDQSASTFYKDTSIGSLLGLQEKIIKVRMVDDAENLWFDLFDSIGHSGYKMVAWRVNNGSYHLQNLNQERIYDFTGKSMYPEPDKKITWNLGKKLIVRQDLNLPVSRKKFYALVRSVTYQHDSLIYARASRTGNREISVVLPFKNNSFRFEYASPTYYNEQGNKFQYYLEGYDPDWSAWTNETQKDFTNLPEGTFKFRVKAKNIFNEISEEDAFSFSILPPWYRTWWAYLLCGLGGLVGIYTIVRWRSEQLTKEKILLEKTISERTEELKERNAMLGEQKNQLALQTEKLKEMDQMKSRLFANISHEFRTPLTLIKGPLDQLKRYPESHLDEARINMMQRNADRLLRLVNQLLDLSKLDAGSLKLNPTEGNLFQCIRTTATAFSSHAAERNLDYQIHIPANNVWASFDRDKIEKIVYNLLSNAFKFTSDEGSIIISTAFKKDQLNLEIKDTGKGIPSKDLYRIFDRFYQIDDSTSKSQEGSGIGLALVKELVELLKGTITLDSELGKGSSFYVNLPLTRILEPTNKKERLVQLIEQKMPVAQLASTIRKTTASEKASGESILIVEDNPDMQIYISEQLGNDYAVVQALNGPAGLKKAIESLPDLIITDLMMPEMDGLQLCEILKTDERTCHIPVVMLTAKAGIENKLQGLETGADSYLTKPFDARELKVRIKNLIDQRNKLRQVFSKIDLFKPQDINWPSLDQKFLEKVLELLETRHGESDFGVTEMQRELAMSKTQLHRKMKALTDQAPGEFLRNFRLKRAAQILINKGENVTQTAYTVGFNNLSYFAKCFKELHGVSPSEFGDLNKII